MSIRNRFIREEIINRTKSIETNEVTTNELRHKPHGITNTEKKKISHTQAQATQAHEHTHTHTHTHSDSSGH